MKGKGRKENEGGTEGKGRTERDGGSFVGSVGQVAGRRVDPEIAQKMRGHAVYVLDRRVTFPLRSDNRSRCPLALWSSGPLDKKRIRGWKSRLRLV